MDVSKEVGEGLRETCSLAELPEAARLYVAFHGSAYEQRPRSYQTHIDRSNGVQDLRSLWSATHHNTRNDAQQASSIDYGKHWLHWISYWSTETFVFTLSVTTDPTLLVPPTRQRRFERSEIYIIICIICALSTSCTHAQQSVFDVVCICSIADGCSCWQVWSTFRPITSLFGQSPTEHADNLSVPVQHPGHAYSACGSLAW